MFQDLISEMQFAMVIATGVFAFLTQFGALIWRMSRLESSIRDSIKGVESDLETKINNAVHEGELCIQKIKQEIAEARLEATGLYLRRDAFREVLNTIDARLIRLEGKLDGIAGRVHA